MSKELTPIGAVDIDMRDEIGEYLQEYNFHTVKTSHYFTEGELGRMELNTIVPIAILAGVNLFKCSKRLRMSMVGGNPEQPFVLSCTFYDIPGDDLPLLN